jgi:hypothetical protein
MLRLGSKCFRRFRPSFTMLASQSAALRISRRTPSSLRLEGVCEWASRADHYVGSSGVAAGGAASFSRGRGEVQPDGFDGELFHSEHEMASPPSTV